MFCVGCALRRSIQQNGQSWIARQITDKVCFQKCYCQNEQIASLPSLPCAKGGAEERGGGIVIHINSIKNNPSVASRQLPLHKGASLFCAN